MATTFLTRNSNVVLSVFNILSTYYRIVAKKRLSLIDILYKYMIKYGRIWRKSMRLELAVLRKVNLNKLFDIDR